MVSIDRIKGSLGDFIRRADRYHGRKLEAKITENISKSLNLLADLLGQEGFLKEAGKIRMISAKISRNSELTQEQIKELRSIFHILESE